MTIVVTASSLVKTSFNFTETESSTIRSENEAITANRAYTYGSGDFQIDAAIKNTGVLPSGGSVVIDVTAMANTSFGITSTVAFSGIKTVTVYNTSTVKNRDINIRATGSNAFTNIFNGGSGNLLIKPYSSFTYNDPYKLATSSTQKNISLFDVSGSGATYEICVLGNLI
jgi:hypothetical protein